MIKRVNLSYLDRTKKTSLSRKNIQVSMEKVVLYGRWTKPPAVGS